MSGIFSSRRFPLIAALAGIGLGALLGTKLGALAAVVAMTFAVFAALLAVRNWQTVEEERPLLAEELIGLHETVETLEASLSETRGALNELAALVEAGGFPVKATEADAEPQERTAPAAAGDGEINRIAARLDEIALRLDTIQESQSMDRAAAAELGSAFQAVSEQLADHHQKANKLARAVSLAVTETRSNADRIAHLEGGEPPVGQDRGTDPEDCLPDDPMAIAEAALDEAFDNAAFEASAFEPAAGAPAADALAPHGEFGDHSAIAARLAAESGGNAPVMGSLALKHFEETAPEAEIDADEIEEFETETETDAETDAEAWAESEDAMLDDLDTEAAPARMALAPATIAGVDDALEILRQESRRAEEYLSQGDAAAREEALTEEEAWNDEETWIEDETWTEADDAEDQPEVFDHAETELDEETGFEDDAADLEAPATIDPTTIDPASIEPDAFETAAEELAAEDPATEETAMDETAEDATVDEEVFAEDAVADAAPHASIEAEPVAAPVARQTDPTDAFNPNLVLGDIGLAFQGVFSLPEQTPRFFECFSRRRDVDGDLTTRADHIRSAKAAGEIHRIDNAAMNQCVAAAKRLRNAQEPVGLFCNLSMISLRNEDFLRPMIEHLASIDGVSERVVIELSQLELGDLTESDLGVLQRLREKGFRFSLDHIVDWSVDVERFAKVGFRFFKVGAPEFLERVRTSRSGAQRLNAVFKDLGIELIVEKVEEQAELDAAIAAGVPFAQGEALAPPRSVQ